MKRHIFTGRSSGFTLLEILLTIAIIAILSAVTLSAINPIRQMSQARDSQRKSDVSELHKAVQQYFIDKGSYPVQISDDSAVYGICNSQIFIPTSSSSDLSSSIDCGDLVNIARVLPTYLSGIPVDPMSSKLGVDSLYRIAASKITGVYVEAPKTEIGQGDKKTVIYVGKPPRGYTIPTIALDFSTTTIATYISNASEVVAGWPAWVNQVIILIVGIIIGYILSRHEKSPKVPKKTP
ncbi:MAG: prepilin-type N-terminal cleavage/methylation domain-containing protein [Candidatus Taylorbacteria bacterium]